MKIEDLLGQTFKFYGVCDNEFKLGRYVLRAEEDENDGYRSMLGEFTVVERSQGIFSRRPLAQVRFEAYEGARHPGFPPTGEMDGYQLVDVYDQHVWLRVGTDNYDNWYPCFVFDFNPKRISTRF